MQCWNGRSPPWHPESCGPRHQFASLNKQQQRACHRCLSALVRILPRAQHTASMQTSTWSAELTSIKEPTSVTTSAPPGRAACSNTWPGSMRASYSGMTQGKCQGRLLQCRELAGWRTTKWCAHSGSPISNPAVVRDNTCTSASRSPAASLSRQSAAVCLCRRRATRAVV